MNQYQFRLYLNILFKYSLSLLMLGWEVQSFKYTFLHWNFLLFRNNLKTHECRITCPDTLILLSIICDVFHRTLDWHVCGTVHTMPQQYSSVWEQIQQGPDELTAHCATCLIYIASVSEKKALKLPEPRELKAKYTAQLYLFIFITFCFSVTNSIFL